MAKNSGCCNCGCTNPCDPDPPVAAFRLRVEGVSDSGGCDPCGCAEAPNYEACLTYSGNCIWVGGFGPLLRPLTQGGAGWCSGTQGKLYLDGTDVVVDLLKGDGTVRARYTLAVASFDCGGSNTLTQDGAVTDSDCTFPGTVTLDALPDGCDRCFPCATYGDLAAAFEFTISGVGHDPFSDPFGDVFYCDYFLNSRYCLTLVDGAAHSDMCVWAGSSAGIRLSGLDFFSFTMQATLQVVGGTVVLWIQNPFPPGVVLDLIYVMSAKDFDCNGSNTLNRVTCAELSSAINSECSGIPSSITITPTDSCGPPPPPPPCDDHSCIPVSNYELVAEWTNGTTCLTAMRGCLDPATDSWVGQRSTNTLQVNYPYCVEVGEWTLEQAPDDDPAGCVMRLFIFATDNTTVLATYTCAVTDFLCDGSTITFDIETDSSGCSFSALAYVTVNDISGLVGLNCTDCGPCGESYAGNMQLTYGALSYCMNQGTGCDWAGVQTTIPTTSRWIYAIMSFQHDPKDAVVMQVFLGTVGVDLPSFDAVWVYSALKSTWDCGGANTMTLLSESCGSTHTTDIPGFHAPATLSVTSGGC